MKVIDRKEVRRRELWAEQHRGHDIRRNAAGALRCSTCYQTGRRFAQPDDGIVDEVVIARLLAGKEVVYTVRERAVAAHRMDAAGVGRNEIARRLGLSGTVMVAILGAPEPGEEVDDGSRGGLDELDGPPEGWADDEVGLAVAA